MRDGSYLSMEESSTSSEEEISTSSIKESSPSQKQIFIARYPILSLGFAILFWNMARPAGEALITDLKDREFKNPTRQFTDYYNRSIADLMQKGQKFLDKLHTQGFKALDAVELSTEEPSKITSPERPLLDKNLLALLLRQDGLLDRFIAEQQETEIQFLQRSGMTEDEAKQQLATKFRKQWVHGEHDFIRDYLVVPVAILIACVAASAVKEKCSSSDREMEQNDLDQLPSALRKEITKIAIYSQFEIPHEKSELFQQIHDAIRNYESGDISKIISNADIKVAEEMFKILLQYLVATTLPLVFLEQVFPGLSLNESVEVHQDALKAGFIKGSIAALCCKFIAFKEAEKEMSGLFKKDGETGQFILNEDLFEEFKTKHPERAEKLLTEFHRSSQPDSSISSPRQAEATPILQINRTI